MEEFQDLVILAKSTGCPQQNYASGKVVKLIIFFFGNIINHPFEQS